MLPASPMQQRTIEKISNDYCEPRAAITAITLLGVSADGYPRDIETQVIREFLKSCGLFSDISDEQLNFLLNTQKRELQRQGSRRVYEQAKSSLSQDLFERACQLTDDICAALQPRTAQLDCSA
ncbi:MAG: hypothetical protein AAGG02_04390 [Cyanobacteria bacterium P01_H01_bin.15]